MKWTTRERPNIDRIACLWLISRFINPAADFLYVPLTGVLKVDAETGATPYDIPGVKMTHQSAGQYAMSLGLSQVFKDDHDMLRHGMVVYEALYAWCMTCQAETHNWPPQMA